MSKRDWLRGTTGSLIVALAPVPAMAQQSDSEATKAGSGEIVVTAQKREERLIDVPQSVSSVSAADLARLNATQLRDFANTVPALSFTSSGVGQSQISLRGVTAGVDIGPTVGIYVDDVPYGSSSAFTNAASLGLDAGLFDLERLEVLRGPQGTLYGASAMGGVLRYINRTPSLTRFEGTARAGLSFTNHGGTNYDAAVALSAPIAQDTIGLRASGFYAHDGGFVDDIARGEDDRGRSRVYGGRLDMLFQPTGDLSVRLSGFAQNIRRDGSTAADYTLAGRPVDGPLDQRRVRAEPFEQRFRLASGTVTYDFGPATLTSISSYQTVRTEYRQDASAVYVPVLGSLGLDFSATPIDQARSTDKFAQEVRLASSSGSFVEWLVGGFYTHEDSDNRQQVVAFDPAGARSPIDLATASIPSSFEEIAVFGNATLHFTPKFDVTGGLRWARNSQRFEQNASGLLAGPVPAVEASDEVVTYLANARYRFSRNATAYVRFATGYRPGGPNFVAADPVTGAPLAAATFKSDSLRSYEAGFKGETADRTFSIDVSGYHIDWQDIQAATAAGGVSVIANAGTARINGAELTLRARPMSGFTVSGAFAYQDARLTQDAPVFGASEGDRLPNVPEFTAALNADYEPTGPGLSPTLGATLRFVSDRLASFDANPGLPQYALGDYVTIDLRAGVSTGPVDVRLFVRNLTDSRGQLSANTAFAIAGGPAQVTLLQPRTIGLSAAARF